MLRPVWLWMSHRGVQHVMATSPGSNCGTVEVCQLAERERKRKSPVERLHWSRNHIVLLIVPPDRDASDSSDDAFANS